MSQEVYILSIAGFDPSGGAGILADIKTFEAHKVQGLGVCSSITFQNDVSFEGVNWLKEEDIIGQLDVLMKRFSIGWVKIGLIENVSVLKSILSFIKKHDASIQIIWDPILSASAGYTFHSGIDREDLLSICQDLYLITPNLKEMKKLVPEMDEEKGAQFISKYCHVLLKGGHREGGFAKDILYEEETQFVFEIPKLKSEKHGTGCVLSSAILCNLAKGYDLSDACKEGKEYVTDFINSHHGLLGFHYV